MKTTTTKKAKPRREPERMEPALLTITQAMQILNISRPILKMLVDTGQLKMARLGRRTYRVSASDVYALVK